MTKMNIITKPKLNKIANQINPN